MGLSASTGRTRSEDSLGPDADDVDAVVGAAADSGGAADARFGPDSESLEYRAGISLSLILDLLESDEVPLSLSLLLSLLLLRLILLHPRLLPLLLLVLWLFLLLLLLLLLFSVLHVIV